MVSKVQRPVRTIGKTIMKTTGCGHLYVTIAGDGHGHDPIELFTRLGKAGACTICQNEAVARCVSLGLKYGVPVQEFIDELFGIRCENPNMFPKTERTLSCPDAIARALKEYTDADCPV